MEIIESRKVLPRYALFAGLLAATGLPIYIHAPKFYVDEYGVSLASIGAALVVLRLLDVVQDPLLGRLAFSLRSKINVAAGFSVLGLASGMIGLFGISAPFMPLLWMGLCLFVLFTSYSFLTILLYSRGIQIGEELGSSGHTQLAGWRETGALVGISLASIAPFLFQSLGVDPYRAFAVVFAALAVFAGIAMHAHWGQRIKRSYSGFTKLLADHGVRKILILGFFNAAPVAVTSSLFLFFVEYRLEVPDLAGPFLLMFFVSAAVSAPFWARTAGRFGTVPTLTLGMILSVFVFGWAYTLGTGEAWQFALICLASGAALGADMTILPAMFSARISETDAEGELAFGLWNFATKLTLAIAAATVLPLLEQGGFKVGEPNSAAGLNRLAMLYALVPCGLKILALLLLWTTPNRKVATC